MMKQEDLNWGKDGTGKVNNTKDFKKSYGKLLLQKLTKTS